MKVIMKSTPVTSAIFLVEFTWTPFRDRPAIGAPPTGVARDARAGDLLPSAPSPASPSAAGPLARVYGVHDFRLWYAVRRTRVKRSDPGDPGPLAGGGGREWLS